MVYIIGYLQNVLLFGNGEFLLFNRYFMMDNIVNAFDTLIGLSYFWYFQIGGGNADMQQETAPIGEMTQQGLLFGGSAILIALIIGLGIYFFRRWKITRY